MTADLRQRLLEHLATVRGDQPRGAVVAWLRRRGMNAQAAADTVAAMVTGGQLVATDDLVRLPRRSPEDKAAWSLWVLVPPTGSITPARLRARTTLDPDEFAAVLDRLLAARCVRLTGGLCVRGEERP